MKNLCLKFFVSEEEEILKLDNLSASRPDFVTVDKWKKKIFFEEIMGSDMCAFLPQNISPEQELG